MNEPHREIPYKMYTQTHNFCYIIIIINDNGINNLLINVMFVYREYLFSNSIKYSCQNINIECNSNFETTTTTKITSHLVWLNA